MLASEFAEKCRRAATETKTLYVHGGWGQPLTAANKKSFIARDSWNRGHAKDINAATDDTFAFDCVCFVKSMIDGFAGDPKKPYGGATYNKPCQDVGIKALMDLYCVEKSGDMSNIMPGEYLVYADYSHCGIYLGNGEVAECTYRWKNGVQITKIDQPERKNLWGYHGKLWLWMDYNYRSEYIGIQTGAYKSEANAKKYMRNSKIQHMFYVEPYYKNAYTFDTEAEARAALPGIQEEVKGAFITKYKASDLVI